MPQGAAGVLPIWGLKIEGTKYVCYYKLLLLGEITAVQQTGSAAGGVYTHVACVWKPLTLGGTMEIYINGALEQST